MSRRGVARVGDRRGQVLAWIFVVSELGTVACGGNADGGERDDPPLPEDRVVRAPEPPPRTVVSPEPEPAEPPSAEELAAELEANPPNQLSEAEFNLLLDVHCGDCHRTPACSAACDGYWFDDWADLSREGEEYMLERIVEYMSTGAMPPGQLRIPENSRDRMIEFILASQLPRKVPRP